MADNTGEFFSASAFKRVCDRAGRELGLTTKKAIAAELDVTPTTLSSLLNGRSTPSLKLLTRMVEVFGGELADYLDMPPRQSWELKHYRIASGWTQAALAQELGIAPSAVSGWELGKYPPNSALIPRLATLFRAPEDSLRKIAGNEPAVSTAQTPTLAVGAGDALTLAEALAETVLGFAASAASAMNEPGLSQEARDQMNAEIRARAEQALTMLATLIGQLPPDARNRAVSLVGRLSDVHEKANSR